MLFRSIVFDDVDIASVAKIAAGGKYRNAGQVCISPTRFFVHETKYKQFVDAFTEIAAGLKLGDGLDPSSQMGPMANARRLEAMDMFVSDAKAKGAVIKTGGERPANQGFFYKPTVLADVPAEGSTSGPFDSSSRPEGLRGGLGPDVGRGSSMGSSSHVRGAFANHLRHACLHAAVESGLPCVQQGVSQTLLGACQTAHDGSRRQFQLLCYLFV